MTLSRYSIHVASTAIALAFSSPCGATPNFPAVVQKFVGAASAPSCTICHNNPSGGLGTATTAFATYLRSHGLVAYDENSLNAALTTAQSENHDSNMDGISDIDALKQGMDPNGASLAQTPPGYGCQLIAAKAAKTTTQSIIVFSGCLVLCLIVARRRANSRL